MRIFVTWPEAPEKWEKRIHHGGNYQQAYHYFRGLIKRFSCPVYWLDWTRDEFGSIEPGDWLITHPSWPPGSNGFDRIQRFRAVDAHVGLIMNDPLYNYPRTDGCYTFHGYNGFDNRGMNRCDGQNGFANQQLREMELADFILCHSNPVAMKLWNEDHGSILITKHLIGKADFSPIEAPIDKKVLYREIFTPDKKRFLVGNGLDHRKQQQQVKALVNDLCVEFEKANWFYPESYQHIIDNCSFLVHPSLQEAYPYMGLECMAKGLLMIGGEDWYDGFRYEELIWRQAANGSTEKDNLEKLKFWMSDDPKVRSIYRDVMERFYGDSSNEWDAFMDKVYLKMVSHS